MEEKRAAGESSRVEVGAARDAVASSDGQGTDEPFVQVFSRNLPTWVNIELPPPEPEQDDRAEAAASAQEAWSPGPRSDRWGGSPSGQPSPQTVHGESPAGSRLTSAARQLEPSFSPVQSAGYDRAPGYAPADSLAAREGPAPPVDPIGGAAVGDGSPALQRLAATEQAVRARVAALRDSPVPASAPAAAALNATPKIKSVSHLSAGSGGDGVAISPQVRIWAM